MNTLSQLQQSNPSKYREVTQQIATNLQKAATTAQSEGDATEADQLSQLAGQFSGAALTSQFPDAENIADTFSGSQDATGAASGAEINTNNTASPPAETGGTSPPLDQLLQAIEATNAQSIAANPMAMIYSTLGQSG